MFVRGWVDLFVNNFMKKFNTLLFFLLVSISFGQVVSNEKLEFDKIYSQVNNKNKWGADDKLGTINYITSEKILSALKIPSKGISVSLAFNMVVDSTRINSSTYDHFSIFSYKQNFAEHNGYNWIVDNYEIAYHGFTHSHIDGINHLSKDGKMYNGITDPSILGVDNYKNGIISKGILIDVPLLHNKEYVEAGYKVTLKDIIDFEKKYNVKIENGDVLLIRTGRWVEKKIKGDWDFPKKSAGIHYNIIPFLSEREIAVLGSDGTNDSNPPLIKEEGSPIHMLTLVAMGMPLLDNLNLDELSKKAQELNEWEFLISFQPLRFEGGTGSPLNALAIF